MTNMLKEWKKDYKKYCLTSLKTPNSVLDRYRKVDKATLINSYTKMCTRELAGTIVLHSWENKPFTYTGSVIEYGQSKKNEDYQKIFSEAILPNCTHYFMDENNRELKITNLLSFVDFSQEHRNSLESALYGAIEELRTSAWLMSSIPFDEFVGNMCDKLKIIGDNSIIPEEEKLELIGANWYSMMISFFKAKIPFTPSLMHKYTLLTVRYFIHLDKGHKRFESIVEATESTPMAFDIMYSYLSTGEINRIVTCVMEDANFEFLNNESLKKKEVIYKIAYAINKIISELRTNSIEPFDALKFSVSTLCWVGAQGRERIATENEVYQGITELNIKHTNIISEEKIKMLKLAVWANTGSDSLLFGVVPGVEKGQEEYSMIMKMIPMCGELIEWVESGEMTYDIQLIKENIAYGEYKYPKFAEDELKPDVDMVGVIKFLMNNKGALQEHQLSYVLQRVYLLKDKLQFKNSLNDIVSYLSLNQKVLLRKAFNIITGKESNEAIDKNKKNGLDEPTKQIMQVCKEIKDGVEQGLIPSGIFALRVISSLERYGYHGCSPKQRVILLDSYKKYVTDNEKMKAKLDIKYDSAFDMAPAEITLEIEQKNKGIASTLMEVSDLLGSGIISI